MPPSGLPTGTVSSGRDGSPRAAATRRDDDADPETRIAELERENDALRAAVDRQRRENERIVERYERLLERERADRDGMGDDAPSDAADAESSDTLGRVARFLGL
ncbi:hypothetical protein [Haloplanus natans]|uniref:hypothetical protein n=1 Tax=Haloplanus natans TaxID=376171 RepID=UPI000677F9AD|nr:hypothetical protein [Haloplanus natans]